jgi:Fe-S-cluster containining protein
MAEITKRIFYDCGKCIAYCCSIYDRVVVNKRDMKRLARYHGVTTEQAQLKYTRKYKNEDVLRRTKDPIFGKSCMFLHPETRGCTIYHGRPQVCREYPDQSRCGYYDILQFEREQQGDPDVLPLVQITFK